MFGSGCPVEDRERDGHAIPARLRELPKVELHLHLDCCLSYAAASILEPGLTRAQFDAEARFAPHQHRQRGLDLGDVVDAVEQAIRAESRDAPPACGLILCGLWSGVPDSLRGGAGRRPGTADELPAERSRESTVSMCR
jgi:adenosine deaminase